MKKTISLSALPKQETVTMATGTVIMFPEAYGKSLPDCSPVITIIVNPLHKI
jgi:hypothetical protein